jgi:hypothetical protein
VLPNLASKKKTTIRQQRENETDGYVPLCYPGRTHESPGPEALSEKAVQGRIQVPHTGLWNPLVSFLFVLLVRVCMDGTVYMLIRGDKWLWVEVVVGMGMGVWAIVVSNLFHQKLINFSTASWLEQSR